MRYAIIKGMLNRADYYASSDKSYPLEIDGEYKGRYLGRLIIDELKAEKKSLRDDSCSRLKYKLLFSATDYYYNGQQLAVILAESDWDGTDTGSSKIIENFM